MVNVNKCSNACVCDINSSGAFAFFCFLRELLNIIKAYT